MMAFSFFFFFFEEKEKKKKEKVLASSVSCAHIQGGQLSRTTPETTDHIKGPVSECGRRRWCTWQRTEAFPTPQPWKPQVPRRGIGPVPALIPRLRVENVKPTVTHDNFKAPKLQSFKTKLQGSKVPKLQNSKTPNLQGSKASKLQSCSSQSFSLNST